MPNCTRCGRDIEPWEMGIYYGSFVCSGCYEAKSEERAHSEICTRCFRHFKKSEVSMRLGQTLCGECEKEELRDRALNTCEMCGRRVTDPNEKRLKPDGHALCVDCYHKTMGGMRLGAKKCARCGKETIAKFVTEAGELYCPTCSGDVLKKMREKTEDERKVLVVEEETPIIRKLKGIIEKILND